MSGSATSPCLRRWSTSSGSDLDTEEAVAHEPAWSESASRHFIEVGQVFTPRREEIEQTFLDLIPAQPDQAIRFVELGTGTGWLSKAILEKFPRSTGTGLDGSDVMLEEAARRLGAVSQRLTLRRFRLEDHDWRTTIGANLSSIVSSLVIHHLNGAEKRRLYRDLLPSLAPGGALLIADIVEAASDGARHHAARTWEAEVKARSLRITGGLDIYKEFLASEWNLFDHPDPMDMPSTIAEHLSWLREAGFEGCDVFWAFAGHAVYGGYRPA